MMEQRIYRERRRNYAQHFECRKYVLGLPIETQEKYNALSMAFPEWNLNNEGAVQMDEYQEKTLIDVANQNGLQAWYLISFYTSQDGWNQFLGKFNALPEDEPFVFSVAYEPRKKRTKKLSTAHVDN